MKKTALQRRVRRPFQQSNADGLYPVVRNNAAPLRHGVKQPLHLAARKGLASLRPCDAQNVRHQNVLPGVLRVLIHGLGAGALSPQKRLGTGEAIPEAHDRASI